MHAEHTVGIEWAVPVRTYSLRETHYGEPIPCKVPLPRASASGCGVTNDMGFSSRTWTDPLIYILFG